MRTISNLLRLPNLLIIALTFLLLRYLVFSPVYEAYSIGPQMKSYYFLIMVISTILIAAAGYISNDYFDVVTDQVNKPEKQYIGKQFTADSALITSVLFSIIAAALAFWLSLVINSFVPAFLLLLALVVAWWYAIRLKKSFLWGNIAVSCMSAGTIVMAWLIERQCSQIPAEPSSLVTSIIAAISIFAFLISLLREMVKDIEDIEGDKLMRCRSMPIIKGIPFTKNILLIITAFTYLLLIITQIYLQHYSRLFAALWLLFFVEVPFVYFVLSLLKSSTKADFHKLSSLLKWIMLGGIASIVAGQF